MRAVDEHCHLVKDALDNQLDSGSGLNSPNPADTRLRLNDNREAIKPRPLQAMSEEQLKAFLEAVKADAGLQEKLKTATDADAVVAIAMAAGFLISTEELQKAQTELSDEELEGVAGGNLIFCTAQSICN